MIVFEKQKNFGKGPTTNLMTSVNCTTKKYSKPNQLNDVVNMFMKVLLLSELYLSNQIKLYTIGGRKMIDSTQNARHKLRAKLFSIKKEK
jgi:hypothetical protein